MAGDVEIEVRIERTTPLAVFVDAGGKEPVWVPKSQISDWCGGPDKEPGIGTTSIFIPEWLAIKAGLV
jgi:hypothetical protein